MVERNNIYWEYCACLLSLPSRKCGLKSSGFTPIEFRCLSLPSRNPGDIITGKIQICHRVKKIRSNEEKAALGVEILKNCRNELYSYFPYLDGAFASVSYETGKGVKGIGTEGNVFYFDPVFLLAGYGNNSEVIRRGYLHMMLHCLFLHLFSNKEQRQDIWNLACDISVEQVIEREALPGLRLPDHPVRKRCLEGRSLSAERICRMLVQGVFSDSLEELQTAFCFDDHSLWTAQQDAERTARTKSKWEKGLIMPFRK